MRKLQRSPTQRNQLPWRTASWFPATTATFCIEELIADLNNLQQPGQESSVAFQRNEELGCFMSL
eukprot:1157679-Pelagomonas_calceolata.AAC.5